MQNLDCLEFCSLAVNFSSFSGINFLSWCISADSHVFFQGESSLGSLSHPVPQFWLCIPDAPGSGISKKNALRDILSLWGIHFWLSRRGKIGTDLYSRKKVKKAGIAISPGGKNDVLKETYWACFVQNKACAYVDFRSMYANQQITAYYSWIKVLIQLFFINKTCESDIGLRTCLIREAVVKWPMTSSVCFLHVKQPRIFLNPSLVTL